MFLFRLSELVFLELPTDPGCIPMAVMLRAAPAADDLEETNERRIVNFVWRLLGSRYGTQC